MGIDQLIGLGRSWACAPELSVTGSGAVSSGFDRSRKCYRLRSTAEDTRAIEFTLSGSKDSPIFNPAFTIENWNTGGARVLVNGEEFREAETGIRHKLDGTNLTVFLWIESQAEIEVRIEPRD